MTFEQHRFRLVKLLDSLIDRMEGEEDFHAFHLDGQMILIRDYLEIRPERRESLLRLVRENRIQVGPWFVLQDEYLTSGEAAVRNMAAGLRLCRELGVEPVPVGYMPDAFGNISQIPQLLAGFEIGAAVFGRGLNVMGADNKVMDTDAVKSTEVRWRSPDGSEVLGIMMANWYNNANELPVDPVEAANRLQNIVQAASRLASTPHLLGMNGCDHQPVQLNLPKALSAMQASTDEVEVRFSSMKEYVEAVSPYKEQLPIVEGELAGQGTSGWGLLENTASSRIDLKQKNHRVQNCLEREAEPFSVLAYKVGGRYDRDYLRYAWETLMQNHPHDSICCCSIDDVHREISTRFDKAQQVAKLLAQQAMGDVADRINTAGLDGYPVVVFNKEPYAVTERVEVFVDLPEDAPEASLSLVDAQGRDIQAAVEPLGRTFSYTLPDDAFRVVTYVNRYKLTFESALPALGWSVFTARPTAQPAKYSLLSCTEREAENNYVALRIQDDGSLVLRDKKSGREYRNFLLFEDGADKGDEYTYCPIPDGTVVTTRGFPADISIVQHTPFSVTYRIAQKMPTAHGAELGLASLVTLNVQSPRVDVRTEIENTAENHRLRVLFPTDIDTDVVYADGQFDILCRPIVPGPKWTNPVHTQRCQQFIELRDSMGGVVVAGRGLHEYEILPAGNVMALTLLRAVGRLGDWGVFPTPDSQMLGRHTVEYALVVAGPTETERAAAHRAACAFSEMAVQWLQTGRHGGLLPLCRSDYEVKGDFIRLSSLKLCDDRDTVLMRLYNTSHKPQNASIRLPEDVRAAWLLNLREERQASCGLVDGLLTLSIQPKQIVTLEFL